MEIGQWLSLFSICLLGAMSPGPSLAVVLRSTLTQGRRGGCSSAIAHGAGVGLYGLLTVAGLAVLITRLPALFIALQIAGALYLLWLGSKSLRSNGAATEQKREEQAEGNPALDGFLVAFLNPKLAVFMLALFSQFLQADFQTLQKMIMVATVGITDASWYLLVAALVSRQGFLDKLRRHAMVVDRVFGIILMGLALTVLAGAFAA